MSPGDLRVQWSHGSSDELLAERELRREAVSISGYWKRTRTEGLA